MVNSNYYGMVTSCFFTVLQLRIPDVSQSFSMCYIFLHLFGDEVEPKRVEASLYLLPLFLLTYFLLTVLPSITELPVLP